MDKLLNGLNKTLMPIAVKLDSNRYLTAIKNAFMAAMPLLIIGSFFTLFANLPISGYADFMKGIFGANWADFFTVPNDISMSMMTIYVVIGIASELAISYKLDKISAVFAALAAFFVLTPLETLKKSADGIAVPLTNLGASGLFVGLIAAILAVEILRKVDQ